LKRSQKKKKASEKGSRVQGGGRGNPEGASGCRRKTRSPEPSGRANKKRKGRVTEKEDPTHNSAHLREESSGKGRGFPERRLQGRGRRTRANMDKNSRRGRGRKKRRARKGLNPGILSFNCSKEGEKGMGGKGGGGEINLEKTNQKAWRNKRPVLFIKSSETNKG